MAFSADTAFDYLRRAHAAGRLGHAYLFTGPAEAAWPLACRLAALVNGLPANAKPEAVLAYPDVHVAEPESKSRRIVIEQIRELESALRLRAGVGGAHGRKVAILREADRLQPQAANAFLKTLEEPPAQCLLLLLSAQPEALLDTILSRCIRVALTAPEAAKNKPVAEDESTLLAALQTHAADPRPTLTAAYRLLRDFQQGLAAARARLTAEAESTLAAEEKRYAQTTDAGSDYLSERESALKAQTEARYVAERARLLDVLSRWWGDVLRRQSAGPAAALDLPAARAATETLAERLPARAVLEKLGRLESLREHLGRNVQEALALEVAFLQVFGT